MAHRLVYGISMSDVDVGQIVPSTRDLLQAISTRRKSLALIAFLDPGAPEQQAARLDDLDISAFAFAEAGPVLQRAARATKSVPSLCLGFATDPNQALLARYHGADGVCIDALLSQDPIRNLTKAVQATRMLAVPAAQNPDSLAVAIEAGARAVMLSTSSLDTVMTASKLIPRSIALIADIPLADIAIVRNLATHVDAVVVRPHIHTTEAFVQLCQELDA